MQHIYSVLEASKEVYLLSALSYSAAPSSLTLTNTVGVLQVPASHWSALWSAQEM